MNVFFFIFDGVPVINIMQNHTLCQYVHRHHANAFGHLNRNLFFFKYHLTVSQPTFMIVTQLIKKIV